MLDLRCQLCYRAHLFFDRGNTRFHFGEFLFGSVVQNRDGIYEIGLLVFDALVYLKRVRQLYTDRITA